MSTLTLSDEDLLFDLDLEVVPADGQQDTTIYASNSGGYICVPGSSQCTNTCWNCYSVSRCCMRPV
ncbi:hypothetical protein ACQEUU_08445 [Nonomuraea sp. CA-218870]|uniref:hypothetical protein n=1 Tax=Nonomuraea sp. CA-218870 TaxID=3239998 RepID=UPI003D8A1F9B